MADLLDKMSDSETNPNDTATDKKKLRNQGRSHTMTAGFDPRTGASAAENEISAPSSIVEKRKLKIVI